MAVYEVIIEEVYRKRVIVEDADSFADACKQVETALQTGEIKLTDNDFHERSIDEGYNFENFVGKTIEEISESFPETRLIQHLQPWYKNESLESMLEKVDEIVDDDDFIETEYRVISDYCYRHDYDLTEKEMQIIADRGYDESFELWKEESNTIYEIDDCD